MFRESSRPGAPGRAAPNLGRLGRFLRHDRSGATAVEFAFLLPVLILILVGIMQAGMLFFIQNNMARVAHDTARRVSLGELTTVTGKSYAEDQLVNWGASFNVTVTEPGSDVSVVITVPMAQAAILDIGDIFDVGDLSASAVVRQES